FYLWSELTPLGVALLALGAIFLILNRKKIPLFLWVAMGWGTIEALFVLNIPFPTFESHQVLLGWVYSGFLAATALIFLESRVRKDPFRSLIVSVVLTFFVLIQLTAIGHLWERKKERGAQDYARNLLQIMEPNALYIPTEENEYFPVVGFQESFSFRKDVEVVEPGLDPSEVGAKIRDCVEHNRPLYVTRQWVLPPTCFYQSWGPLWKIVPSSIERVARKNPKASPQVSWGGIGLVGAEVQPSVVQAGGILEVTYRWIRQKGSPADQTRSLVALFADDQDNYWTRDGVLWLQDIHEISSSYFTQMKPGWVYEEKRILFIPSDFPVGAYRLMMGFQKTAPTKGEGQESFNREFYERSAAQDLDKFMGKGGNGSVIQFSTLGPDVFKGGFWPVTKSRFPPPADSRFAPVANIVIQSLER
ncbi:MAG TPA: tripartite tricarboxylate transporter TctB family protein, partial [bacterium]